MHDKREVMFVESKNQNISRHSVVVYGLFRGDSIILSTIISHALF